MTPAVKAAKQKGPLRAGLFNSRIAAVYRSKLKLAIALWFSPLLSSVPNTSTTGP